jgi:hypothetical protein
MHGHVVSALRLFSTTSLGCETVAGDELHAVKRLMGAVAASAMPTSEPPDLLPRTIFSSFMKTSCAPAEPARCRW